MSGDIEIVDFKNFEQFLIYIKQVGKDMQSWSPEKTKDFCDKVVKLREESPEFKEEYDKWVASSERKNKKTVTIGGTEEDKRRSQALLKLKKYQNQKKTTNMNVIIKHKKQYSI